jgi:hypothetical protein
MTEGGATYRNNIFVNCPFDDDFRPLLNAAIFCIFDCRYIPRSALEKTDSSESRIEKLYNLIRVSKLGIHDISRTELSISSGLPRFNMPFELGLFLGAKEFGDNDQKQKMCLILDRERYRYQQFLSDISGQDITDHNNDPERVIRSIRNWLNTIHPQGVLPGAAKIISRYKRFQLEMPNICAALSLDEGDLTFTDYCAVVSQWLSENSY